MGLRSGASLRLGQGGVVGAACPGEGGREEGGKVEAAELDLQRLQGDWEQ